MHATIHQVIIQKSIAGSKTTYARYLKENDFWLKTNAAAAICDSVLNDWPYCQLPRSLNIFHHLREEILAPPAKNGFRISFFLNWASHYLFDPLFFAHRVKDHLNSSWMDESAEELHDQVEVETGEKADLLLKRKVLPWDKGFWESYWFIFSFINQKFKEFYEKWRDKGDYLSLCLENFSYCIRMWMSFLRYLEFRSQNRVKKSPIYKSDIRHIFAEKGLVSKAIPLAVEVNLSRNVPLQDIFVDSEDEADIVVMSPTTSSPCIHHRGGKTYLIGENKDINNLVDLYLDLREARFGTLPKEEIISHWVGLHLLKKKWNNAALKKNIYAQEFYDELTRIRGYQGNQLSSEPEKVSDYALEDKTNEEKEYSDWTLKANKITELFTF